MSESFKANRRFFDDKHYPRGFARHGDYTIREAEILEKHGNAFKELEQGLREAVNKEEQSFVEFCKGNKDAESIYEKTWQKYRNRVSINKRLYTLSGLAGEINDDYISE